MFGRRIVRESELQALGEAIRESEARERAAGARVEAVLKERDGLYERLVAAEGDKRAAQATSDAALVQLNELRENYARAIAKLTGVPQTAARIQQGAPIATEMLGPGGDLFEDVGDDKADKLRAAGVLHDDVGAPIVPPSANELMAGFDAPPDRERVVVP